MPYTVTSLSTLRALMVQRWDQAVFWTDPEARLALNEALRDWNLLTGRWRRTVTLSTAAGTPTVALGATMIYGMRVTMSTGSPVHPTSLLELDLMRPPWRLETTASGGDVPTVPTLWAPRSLQVIEIWPATVGVGVNNLLVDGVSNTPVLVEEGDRIDAGEEIVDYLVDMALHNAAFKEGGPRWRSTMKYFDAFIQAATEENSLLKTNQDFRRWAGLDRRRDLQPSTGAPTQLDALGQGGASAITGEER